MRRFVVLIALTCACSVLTNLGDLQGDGGEASTMPDVIEASTIDSMADDAGLDVDAAIDGPFCGPYADAALIYCEAFDFVSDAAALPVTTSDGATTTLDNTDSISSPNALELEVPPNDAGIGGRAAILENIAVEPMVVTIDFAAKIETFAGPQLNIAAIDAVTSSGTRTASLLLLPTNKVEVQETISSPDASTMYLDHPSYVFTWGSAWHQFHFVLDLDEKTTTLAIDGVPVETHALTSGWVKGLATLHVGVAYTSAAPTITQMRIDNVLGQLSLQ